MTLCLKVNGVDMRDLAHDEAVTFLRQTSSVCTLRLCQGNSNESSQSSLIKKPVKDIIGRFEKSKMLIKPISNSSPLEKPRSESTTSLTDVTPEDDTTLQQLPTKVS